MLFMENKKIIVTSGQYGAKTNESLFRTIEKYCELNNIKDIFIIPLKGKNKYDQSLDKILANYERVSDDIKLNNAIKISSYKILPQQIDPITGLGRLTQSDMSTILGSPKQRFKVIPNSNIKSPKILLTTGAITYPEYRDNRIGMIAQNDHKYGFVVVEIAGNNKYFIRTIDSLVNGSFTDLSKEYKNKTMKEIRPEALVLGDWHTGVTDKKSRHASLEMIIKYEPRNIILHDLFDGLSINHYNNNKKITLSNLYENKKLSLEDELNLVGKELKYIADISPKDSNIVVVKSNHDEFLNKYLESGKFMEEPNNTKIGTYLFSKMLEGKDPLVEGLSKFINIPKNVIFLKRDQDYKIKGWQLGSHGDLGANGGRGSMRNKEYAFGKSITGHCFSDDTEILTIRGWVRGTKLSMTDIVLTMNKKTKKLEWNKINKIFIYSNYTKLYHIKNKFIDLLVTDNHGLIGERANGKVFEFTAKNLSSMKKSVTMLSSSIHESSKKISSLLIKICALLFSRSVVKKNIGLIFFATNKKENIFIQKILKELEVKYHKQENKNKSLFILNKDDSEKLISLLPNKKLSPWLIDVDYNNMKLFVDILIDTLSLKETKYDLLFDYQNDADIFQVLCTMVGYKTKIEQKTLINNGYFGHQVHVEKNNKIKVKPEEVNIEDYEGVVWCISVPNKTLVVRRNGMTVITQNSHTPEILRNTIVVGTNSKLKLEYNKGLSSWLHANALLYPSGKSQLILISNGEYENN